MTNEPSNPMGIVTGLLALAAYLGPGLIAGLRRHRDANAIGMMNLLLGWTVVFWLWALFWSLTGNVEPKAPRA